MAANQANLTCWLTFGKVIGNSWRWEGMGMLYGLVSNGELFVSDSGDQAMFTSCPRFAFRMPGLVAWPGSLQSPRAGSRRSPLRSRLKRSAGKFASQSFIVDRALNPERLTFPNLPLPTWQRLTAGNFDSLEGTIDRTTPRLLRTVH